MAISYNFELATSTSSEQAARELLEVARPLELFDASVTPAQLLEDGAVTHLRTWVRVYATKTKPWMPVVTDFGIAPTVGVVFRIYKHDKFSEQEDDMVRLTSGMLDRFADDAVLSGMENVWLVRKGGDLSVNERNDIWPPERLALLTQPYRREVLAFAEE